VTGLLASVGSPVVFLSAAHWSRDRLGSSAVDDGLRLLYPFAVIGNLVAESWRRDVDDQRPMV
jgi:hypothetical protein